MQVFGTCSSQSPRKENGVHTRHRVAVVPEQRGPHDLGVFECVVKRRSRAMTGWLKELRDHTESDLVSTEDFEVKRRLFPPLGPDP
jgi:hypothetical protein